MMRHAANIHPTQETAARHNSAPTLDPTAPFCAELPQGIGRPGEPIHRSGGAKGQDLGDKGLELPGDRVLHLNDRVPLHVGWGRPLLTRRLQVQDLDPERSRLLNLPEHQQPALTTLPSANGVPILPPPAFIRTHAKTTI